VLVAWCPIRQSTGNINAIGSRMRGSVLVLFLKSLSWKRKWATLYVRTNVHAIAGHSTLLVLLAIHELQARVRLDAAPGRRGASLPDLNSRVS
jgi:hypothetical protein